MPSWLSLILVGCLIYGITLAPVFPAEWGPFARFTGGLVALAGIVVLILSIIWPGAVPVR